MSSTSRTDPPTQCIRDLASAKAAQHRASVKPLIEKMREQEGSLAAIAKELNQSDREAVVCDNSEERDTKLGYVPNKKFSSFHYRV